ncbi:asparagine synthase (glutamine-hydrolyzing) [Franzmannia qiaohouensis]|uniref:asparagine synthase (glutamine-hydrolyzing) n=1 Tax=Franzmannia qiaohouensis TaxID=1329370 RepID=A0ABU1HL03_9GAMM|nr:asparagine synthase (glutamine-hydrolyzing) [Halomonas qiaohouensis]MDR5907489.1 asparagine synthase (glutamine-hydrolyzing) [Halomonas qiaohouensis]
MCGIAGFVDWKLMSDDRHLKAMTDVLHHRGPDDSGYSMQQYASAQVGLGHRRLSILDLTKHGHQPMHYQHLSIIFNGEVYNFQEVRDELERLGYSFDSSSDTEVVLKAYHCWGMPMVHRLNGMFALAILDSRSQKIVLLRDRAGVKPLYWYHHDGLLMFASELKSFHEHPRFNRVIDKNGLALFFQHGYIPQPHTIFKNTRKLKAGHSITVDLSSGDIVENEYWDILGCYRQPKLDVTETEALEETERLMISACEYRMVADVPVGMFLSGGYDSSVVTALLQSNRTDKLKTFAIGFEEDAYNEAHHAKKIANYLGTDHTEYYCTQKDALKILPRIVEIWDEPFGDPSAIPTVLVSELARQRVTVSLSADGGDEIFGGYDKYPYILKLNKYLSKIPMRGSLGSIMSVIDPASLPIINKSKKITRKYTKLESALKAKNSIDLLGTTSNVFSVREVRKLLDSSDEEIVTEFDYYEGLFDDNDSLNSLLAVDYKTYQLDNILVKVDRATMSCSLEGREPLLDYRLIEYVARLRSDLKIKGGDRKYLLKEITHKYIPKELMDRPKMGFGIPLIDWFRDELKDYILHYLSEFRLTQGGVFNVEQALKVRDDYLNGVSDEVNKVWLMVIFEMWRERWM